MTVLTDQSRLGWGDGLLIVAIATLLACSLLLQVSPRPDDVLDGFRDGVETVAARAIDRVQALPEILP